MYTSLYEDGHEKSKSDSLLVMDLVDQAVTFKPELTMLAHFMRDGCLIMLMLSGHNSTWFITWSVDDPGTLDTGMGHLSLFSPQLGNELAMQIDEIADIMTQSCACYRCAGPE